MPELPEVETVVRALRPLLTGKKIAGARFWGRLRTPFDPDRVASLLKGRVCLDVRRRAKYILMDFDCDHVVVAHLGMTGSFRLEKRGAPVLPHDRVALVLAGGRELRFADVRRFGFVNVDPVDAPGCMPASLAHLGMEPLERSFTAAALAKLAAKRSVPVKVFIMNQEVVVGVGNIYASEALHAARLDPRRAASSLGPDEWRRLASAIRAVLRSALRAGGSTIKNYRSVDGNEGRFQRSLHVYDREGLACPACGRVIEMTRQGGRSTYFCPHCQK